MTHRVDSANLSGDPDQMTETTTTPPAQTPVQPPVLVDPAGQPATPAEPTLASRRAELVDVVTKRAQRARDRLESARDNAVARVRKASDALVNSTRDRVPERVRVAVHDRLERAATALHNAAKRLEPRA
jgi:hypothetical protein